MKKILLLLSLVFAIATSCEKGKETEEPGLSTEIYIDASNIKADPTNNIVADNTNNSTWHYISAKEAKVIGSGLNSEDAAWAARTDWDFAIQRLKIRTNSGTSSSTSAKAGVHIFGETVKFADVLSVTSDIVYIADTSITEPSMGGGTVTQSKSTAIAIIVGPMTGGTPTYTLPAIYAFRSADGERHYKVEFTNYLNDIGTSGHVKLNIAEIY